MESWDGTAWTVVPTPNQGSGNNGLHGVSCTRTCRCVAVGVGSGPSNVNQTLIESWNGSVWSILPSPNQGGNNNFLSSVSCTRWTRCTAVGFSINERRPCSRP